MRRQKQRLEVVKPAKEKVQKISTIRLGAHACDVPKCYEQWRTTTYIKRGRRRWRLNSIVCLMNRHPQTTRRGKMFANPEMTKELLRDLNAKKVVPIG
jgi:hypothetical protein